MRQTAPDGDHGKAAADLNAIMVMPTPVRGVTAAARRRLERLQHRQDAADSAIGAQVDFVNGAIDRWNLHLVVRAVGFSASVNNMTSSPVTVLMS